ncbi:hypothetical protein HPP92_003351 [Vanilla planifolia]|uniref:Uncharacterized protein n=1 Tax=Vanilla planifolia TaxID=51239 RepID=A0A835S1L9_VANPL|nr:hypothetical protein HPP92_003351 [Vanilla planifolia]
MNDIRAHCGYGSSPSDTRWSPRCWRDHHCGGKLPSRVSLFITAVSRGDIQSNQRLATRPTSPDREISCDGRLRELCHPGTQISTLDEADPCTFTRKFNSAVEDFRL